MLSLPDISDPLGIRDRAMLELFYSTGLRRVEVARLELADLNREKQTLWVRQGKGQKDRVVPVGTRALQWVEKYIEDVRPLLAVGPSDPALFITGYGTAFNEEVLGRKVRDYILKADPQRKSGGCHLLRHTCATHMLEGWGRHPLHSAVARTRKARNHRHLHPCQHRAAEKGSCKKSSRRVAA